MAFSKRKPIRGSEYVYLLDPIQLTWELSTHQETNLIAWKRDWVDVQIFTLTSKLSPMLTMNTPSTGLTGNQMSFLLICTPCTLFTWSAREQIRIGVWREADDFVQLPHAQETGTVVHPEWLYPAGTFLSDRCWFQSYIPRQGDQKRIQNVLHGGRIFMQCWSEWNSDRHMMFHLRM
jgi:hypothetical protein